MSHIASGVARHSAEGLAEHLKLARAAAAETQALLYVAFDQAYLNQDGFDKLYGICAEISGITRTIGVYLKSNNGPATALAGGPPAARTNALG
jgi:four helix bundle protein